MAFNLRFNAACTVKQIPANTEQQTQTIWIIMPFDKPLDSEKDGIWNMISPQMASNGPHRLIVDNVRWELQIKP